MSEQLQELDLWRLPDDGTRTFGRIAEGDVEICKTIELPWVDKDDNGKRDRNVSRIHEGRYKAVRFFSPGHKRELFKLVGVPDADDIELHIACLPRDLKGCIGLGLSYGAVLYPDMKKAEPGVIRSHDAFDAFMQRMDGVREFWLTIHDAPAPPGTYA